MTGSRKVIDILNHLGHCISYHIAESLETEIAETIQEKDYCTPEGLLRESGLCTALAWDNYDENTETLSSAGTLHDTVGICYQNVTTSSNLVAKDNIQTTSIAQGNNEESTSQHQRISKRRRTFEPKDVHIEPYRKKPHITTFDYQKEDLTVEPPNLKQVVRQDKAWMMSCCV